MSYSKHRNPVQGFALHQKALVDGKSNRDAKFEREFAAAEAFLAHKEPLPPARVPWVRP